MIDWRPMIEAPRDGTAFDVLCKSEAGVEIVVSSIKYAHAPMDKTRLVLFGNTNVLSPYLHPFGWKPRPTKEESK